MDSQRSGHLMKVVLIAPVSKEGQAEIAAVDDRIEVVDAWNQFGPELVGDWPRQTTESYLPRRFWDLTDSLEQRQQRDAVLADAEVVLMTFPPLLHVVSRAPKLKLVHQI